MSQIFFSRFTKQFLLSGIAFVLAACTTSEVEVVTAVPIPSATPESSPTPIASPSPTSSEDEITSRMSVISSVTIYSGPGSEYAPVGILEAGANAQVIETGEENWMKIVCPNDIVDSCWILWDFNSIYLYDGPPMTLNIPDPASLKFETVATEASPDGHWQALVTKSEAVLIVADNLDTWFFYVELKVTSRNDERTWTSVSEWHAAGLGQEEPPQPFYWSKDGRFLYYSSLSYPDGACVFYDNIGDYLDRLDLTDGSVAALQPPYARGILAISPDETMIAYLHGETFFSDQDLIIRELASSYGDASQDSFKWQIPLDVSWPTQVSQIAWSPDNRQVLVTVTELTENCQPPTSVAEWELDVETGEFVEVSNEVFPTATP